MMTLNFNRPHSFLLCIIFLFASGCSQKNSLELALETEQSATETPIPTLESETPASETITETQQATKKSSFVAFLKQSQLPSCLLCSTATLPLWETMSTVAEKSAPDVTKTKITEQHSTLIWKRLLSLFALPQVENKRVEAEIKKLLKYPRHLAETQQRAKPYLHLILKTIEAKKLPAELALLPIIESSFRVNVSSPRSAAGLWQFMPATGRSLGLHQNWWYDGRRDVYASTQAATKYLTQLHKRFKGDWLLALASYNAGYGNVQKAMKRHKTSNYWELKLPRETMRYVPKILALAKIFANAEKYKLPLAKIPDHAVVEVVTINQQLDLSTAAKMANMPIKEFFRLNPAFNRVVTAPKATHHLLIKKAQVKKFKQQLAQLSADKRVAWVKHQVQEGDNLKMIAQKYKTSVKSLLRVNQLKNKALKAGKVLKIPPSSIKQFKKRQSKEA